MNNIPINSEAKLNLEMEEITTKTPAHADSLTPKFKQLLENDSVIVKNLLGYILSTEKGIANGVATLGVDGKVTSTQLPPVQEIPDATINNKGIVKLNNATNSQSQTEASTPKALNDIKKSVDEQIALKANLVSPVFTGIPTVPTAAQGTSTLQAASTAFVQSALAGKADLNAPAFSGYPTAPTPPGTTNSSVIATTAFVKNQVLTKANLASPAFSGSPSAPTASAGSNSKQIATTAFVQNAFDNYKKAGCRANMSEAQNGSNIYFQCNNLTMNSGSYFTTEYVSNWGTVLKALKKMYFVAHVTFIYNNSTAGRKKAGIIRLYPNMGYTNLGYVYQNSAGGIMSISCTMYGMLLEGEYLVAYTQGSGSDVVDKDSYFFVNEL